MGILLLVVGSLSLVGFLCWATLRTAILLRHYRLEANLLLLPSQTLLRLILIGFCLGIGLGSGLERSRLGWEFGFPEAFWGLGTGLILWLSLNLLSLAAVRRFGWGIYSPALLRNILPQRGREWLLVPLALVPAVFLEEILFRSLLVGGFSLFLHPLLLAFAFSLLFGLMHLPQGILGAGATALVGFLLSLLFLWRGSIVAPLIAHYEINLLQLVLASRRPEWLEGMA